MKRLLTLLAFSLSIACFAQAPKMKKDAPPPNPYDSTIAKRLGADDYGMKKYVIGFLIAGKMQIEDSTMMSKLLVLHLKNIQKLAADGKLVVAGPFTDGGTMEGIFIFNVTTIDEAKKLAETDPAVKAGVFEMEYHTWYGSAALMDVNTTHNKIQKKKFIE